MNRLAGLEPVAPCPQALLSRLCFSAFVPLVMVTIRLHDPSSHLRFVSYLQLRPPLDPKARHALPLDPNKQHRRRLYET